MPSRGILGGLACAHRRRSVAVRGSADSGEQVSDPIRSHVAPDTPGQSAKRRPVMRSYAVT